MACLSTAINAHALLITPATPPPVYSDSGDNSNLSAAQITAFLATQGRPGSLLTELYKADVGSPDSGTFASSYDTIYSNAANDPADADIDYVGSATCH